MSRSAAAFTQLDIERAVRGAIKGGLVPGTFKITISRRTGDLHLLPAAIKADHDEAELDAELHAWRAHNGDG